MLEIHLSLESKKDIPPRKVYYFNVIDSAKNRPNSELKIKLLNVAGYKTTQPLKSELYVVEHNKDYNYRLEVYA